MSSLAQVEVGNSGNGSHAHQEATLLLSHLGEFEEKREVLRQVALVGASAVFQKAEEHSDKASHARATTHQVGVSTWIRRVTILHLQIKGGVACPATSYSHHSKQ